MMQRLKLVPTTKSVEIEDCPINEAQPNDDDNRMHNASTSINNINDVAKDKQSLLSSKLCEQVENENNSNRKTLQPSVQMTQKVDNASIHQFNYNDNSMKNFFLQDSLKLVEKNKIANCSAENFKLSNKPVNKISELKPGQALKKYSKNQKLHGAVKVGTFKSVSKKKRGINVLPVKDNTEQKLSTFDSGINTNIIKKEVLLTDRQSNEHTELPQTLTRTSQRKSKPKVFDNCIVYNMSGRRKSNEIKRKPSTKRDSLPKESNVNLQTAKKIINKPLNAVEESCTSSNSQKNDHSNLISTMIKVESKELSHSANEKIKLISSNNETEPIDNNQSDICGTTINYTNDYSINQQSINFSDNNCSSNGLSVNESESTSVSVHPDSVNNEMSSINQQVGCDQTTKLRADFKNETLHTNNVIDETMHEAIPPKRGRGRPRGRPRKIATEEQLTSAIRKNCTSTEISKDISKNEENLSEKDISGTSDELTDDETNKLSPKRRKRKKGRGRRPGRKLIEPDNDYTPRLSLMPTEFHKEYTTIEITFIDNEITCGKCHEKIIKRDWRKHNLDKHNSTAWIEGEQPINYESDEKSWKSILTIAHKQKRGVLFCDKCNTTKRSVLGFISHYKFCGKSEEEKEAMMWICPICRGVFMPSSQDFHERMHRDAERQEKMKDSQSKNNNAEMRRKRKAAEKAASKITEFAELVKDKDEFLAKKFKEVNVNNFIEKPKLTIPSMWKTSWAQALSLNKKAVCRQPGCTFEGSTFEEICNHQNQCSFVPHKNYICKICKFISESLQELKNHVKTSHPDKVAVAEDADFNTNDHTDESEDEKFQSERRSLKSVAKQKQYDKLLKSDRALFLKKAKLYKEESLNVTYTPTFKWTLDFSLKNYKLTMFENFKPNDFLLLKNSDAANYLPKVKTSMRTKQTKALPNNSKSENEDLTEWKIWDRFESSVINQVPTFFVGGPVWSMAWLPIPIPMYSYEIDQYIAISTHPTMDSVHIVGKSYKFNNIIQIWNLGHLAQAPSFMPVTPKLSYAIAHNIGTIWCMEWCPSGTYGSFTLTNDQTENVIKRMGLLAVASSDGCVHIYSLPFPEVLDFTENENHDLPIYKTEPVITLHVNKCLDYYKKVNWQCLKLSWSKLFGHDTIAAGFSNGYVALWNLTNNSPLLVTKNEATLHINANQYFYAHGQAVTYVEIIPIDGSRYLATASLDRCTKFWDLEDTANPIEVVKKGVAVNGAWLTHWPNIFTAYDDVIGLAHTTTYMIGLREGSNKVYPLLPTNSVTYGLAVSDFANGICHGTVAGELAAIFPFQMLYIKDIDKLTKKRWLVSSIEVVDLQDSQKDSNSNDEKEDKKNQSILKDHKYMPETYEECANRFGIVFRDDLNNSKSKGTKKSERRNPLNSDTMKFSPVEQYQFTSVNRIAWNPNAWSYLWIAAGYQNGLVRVLQLKPISLNQNFGTKLLSEYSTKIIDNMRNS